MVKERTDEVISHGATALTVRYQFTFYDILRPNPILLLVEGRCPTWNEPIGDHLDVKLCYSPWKDIIIPGHTDHGRAMCEVPRSSRLRLRARYMRQHARPLEERDILLSFHGRHGGVHEGYKRCEVRNALVSELSQYPDVSVGGFIGNYLEIKVGGMYDYQEEGRRSGE
ncbi:hypothetical protein FOZ62_018716, partial [Perkinsus olseni]